MFIQVLKKGKNEISGEPYIILPQMAVKYNFSLVEFKYSKGDKLKDLVTITNPKCKDDDIKKELKILEKKCINVCLLYV